MDWYDIHDLSESFIRVRCIERGTYPELFAAYLVSTCLHCQTAPCIKACPEKAISKREDDGIVVVNRDRCVGVGECPKRCLKACPWDVPRFGTRADARMHKCQLCLQRLQQGRQAICVESCPMYALDIAPLEVLREKYGDRIQAEGFQYRERFKPSVVFKPKK